MFVLVIQTVYVCAPPLRHIVHPLYVFLLKHENFSPGIGLSTNLLGMYFLIVLEAKGPTQHFHGIENGANGVFLVVLLIVVIHGGGIVAILGIWNKGNARGLTLVRNRGQRLVESANHFVGDGGTVQRKVLFGSNLEPCGLDLEGLFDNHVRHDVEVTVVVCS